MWTPVFGQMMLKGEAFKNYSNERRYLQRIITG